MTEEVNRKAGSAAKLRKIVISLATGGAAGFLGAVGMITAIEWGMVVEPDLSQMIALLVALIYAICGIGVALGAAAPAIGASFLNVEDPDELREQGQVMEASGWGMAALAVTLASTALGGEGGVIAAPAALVIALVSAVIGGILSLRSYRLSDELMRAVMTEAGSTTYYLLFVLLGGWTMLAYLGFVAPPGMLDVLSLFWSLALAAAFWVTGRRGMLAPR